MDDPVKSQPMILDWHLEFDPESDEAFRLIRRAKAGNIDPLELGRAVITAIERPGFQRSSLRAST